MIHYSMIKMLKLNVLIIEYTKHKHHIMKLIFFAYIVSFFLLTTVSAISDFPNYFASVRSNPNEKIPFNIALPQSSAGIEFLERYVLYFSSNIDSSFYGKHLTTD